MSIDIRKIITEYIKKDDMISDLNKEIREIRKEKKNDEDIIKQYMLDNSIAKVDLGNGSLRVSNITVPKRVNKKIIMNVLLESLQEEKAHEIITELFENEESEQITKLERSRKIE